MQKVPRRYIWIERLSLPRIIIFVVQGFFIDTLVTYDEYKIYPSARACLNLLKKINLCNNFYSDKLMLLDKKDAGGKTLRYKAYKNLNSCIERFINNYFPFESKQFKQMLGSYMAINMEPRIIFITKVASEIQEKECKNNIIYLTDNHLNYLIREFYAGKDFLIKEQVSLIEGIKFYFKPYFYIAILFFAKIIPFKIKHNILEIRPSIWVEFNPSFVHAFWFNAIKFQEFDTVAYLDRPDTPATRKIINDIKRRKIKWIDTHFLMLMKIYKPNFLEICVLFKNALLIFTGRLVWLRIFRFEYKLMVSVYKSVFSQFKVKVLVQHQEASWRQQAQLEAMEQVGGIMVGYHWSNYHFYLVPSHFFPQHVYFVWGKLMYECIQKKGNTCKHILPVGITIIPDGEKSLRPRGALENTNFVISIFDDSVPYPGPLSLNSLSEFYLKLLAIIENNPNFLGIIKSRQFTPDTINSLPEGKQIKNLVNGLTEQQRLKFLEPNISPLEAALVSDLSVGFFINSACVVAAVGADCQTIQWDPTGLLEHPFYKDTEQKFIFRFLDDLEKAILNASQGDKSIGDYSHWKRYISYFDDTSSIRRIRDFIESFMRENEKTGNFGKALDFVVQKYKADNKINDDFFKIDNCWEDE